jgi:hypothetical protein
MNDLTQTRANEEMEVLIQKIYEYIKVNWQNSHELLLKQQQMWGLHSREALLRKISGVIRNPVDISKIKHSIVTEVGKTFNADRCFIRLYGPNENILSIEAEYLASPDVKSAKDFKFRNNTKSSILIWAEGIENTLYIGIYGKTVPPKVIWSHVVLNVYKSPVISKKNYKLPPGTEKIIQEGMDGVVIQSSIMLIYPDGTTTTKTLGKRYYDPLPYIKEISG